MDMIQPKSSPEPGTQHVPRGAAPSDSRVPPLLMLSLGARGNQEESQWGLLMSDWTGR